LRGELLEETVVREVLEETGIAVAPRDVAYVSESYDGDEHFLNVTFLVDVVGDAVLRQVQPFDYAPSGRFAQDDSNPDHVVSVEWVRVSEIGERVTIAVVREPLVAFLRGELPRRYAGFHDAGVTIEWPADSQ
jgi:8-oxo-dGTP pyrophosphatase MutT (NUDIX family)